MNRTVEELKKFLETIPDSEEVSFWSTELMFGHYSDGEFGNTPGEWICTGKFAEEQTDDECY